MPRWCSQDDGENTVAPPPAAPPPLAAAGVPPGASGASPIASLPTSSPGIPPLRMHQVPCSGIPPAATSLLHPLPIPHCLAFHAGLPLAAASPTPAASTASASSVPSLGPHAAHGHPRAVLMAQQQYQLYLRMAGLLAGKHRDRLHTVQKLCHNAKNLPSMVGAAAALPPATCRLQCGKPRGCAATCWRQAVRC